MSTQDHRGSIAWVSEAFGAQWGFIDAVWSLATSFLDNALYPLIIADFLGLTGGARWLFVYGSIAGLTWAVYRGSAVSDCNRVSCLVGVLLWGGGGRGQGSINMVSGSVCGLEYEALFIAYTPCVKDRINL